MRRVSMFWPWFLVCLVVAAAFLIYPVYVIRPFRAQHSGELMAALAIIRYRPFVMMACFAASAGLLAWNWRQERGRWRRAFSVLGVMLVGVIALLSRVNIYEQMFHPIDTASFSNVDQAKLDGGEKVIAVTVGLAARAYPIRIVSYHHIVNDILGGEPIVATY